ncbi:MAG: UvrD-helicase domain-containing protein [Bacteroidaceae bacterium]|nr:UvrD-helicase domain-containing protein [Bacteroidaceae bacterium]
MENYLDTFNPPQRAAVEYCDGPSLVIAGAGSGKTRVLTYKIAYLMEQGYQPWSILALALTNKAAGEMKDRIAKIVGVDYARMLWMGTFHSIFLRILRQEHERIGFSNNFTIYDAADSKSLVKTIIKEMELDDKTYKPGTVLGIISNAKNQLVTAEQYAANPAHAQNDARHNMAALGQIFQRYCNRCRQSDAMDFDDILLYTFLLFEQHPDVLAKWEQRFRYVLVDEYQDTNYAQHRIVWQLTRQHRHVCVVGDDAQSIYSFRGANIDNILTFQRIYEGAKLFKLERNYRSTQNIVEAANSLIKKNSRQIQKNIFSENEKGERLHVLDTHSDLEEAKMVVNAIRGIKRREGCEYSDFAVLYRTNAQSRVFEDTLRKEAMPYRIYGGLSFYQRKEIKDVLAYFRLAVNPNDEEAFKRVINYPTRGIGQTTIGKILATATQHEVSLWSVISNPEAYQFGVSKGTLTKIMQFREMIAGFVDQAQKLPANQIGTMIVKQSGIIADIYQDSTPENLSRQENVEELINGMQDFCDMRMEEGNENISLNDYLSEVSLLSDVDTDKSDDEHKVTLMTIHSAKGLEFGTVFVVGLEEGLFPSDMVSGNPREMEEERRLFYVAITRAKTHCYLSYAQCRFRYGQMEFSAPSRFLKDIDPKYLDKQQSMFSSQRNIYDDVQLPWARRKEQGASLHSKPSPLTSKPSPVNSHVSPPAPCSSPLTIGKHILHNRFGRGQILRIEGTGDNTKATVQFENVGTKQLLLKFAKFEVLD